MYSFVDNEPVGWIDFLGLQGESTTTPSKKSAECDCVDTEGLEEKLKHLEKLAKALQEAAEILKKHEEKMRWIRFRHSLERLRRNIAWRICDTPDYVNEELRRMAKWFEDMKDTVVPTEPIKPPPSVDLPPSQIPKRVPKLPGSSRSGVPGKINKGGKILRTPSSPKSPVGSFDIYNYIKLHKSFTAVSLCIKTRNEYLRCISRNITDCEIERKRTEFICGNAAKVTDIISRLP